MLFKCTILLAALLVITVVAVAHAQPPPSPTSDSLTLFLNGQPAGAIPVFTEAIEADFGGGVYYPTIAIDPAQFGFATALLEPNGSVSDIFGVIQISIIVNGTSTPTLYLGFVSEVEGQGVSSSLFGGAPTFSANEADGPIDVSRYLSPDLRGQGYTASFTSDFEPTTVPEPTSIALLGLGLAGLAAWRRHRTQ